MRKNILTIIVLICLVKNIVIGQHWSPLGEGIKIAGYYYEAWVNSIVTYNGEVYAGGVFDSAGGIAVNSIAKWNGTSWSPVGAGVILNGGPNGHVRTMIVLGGELYVGGLFDSAGGIAAKNIAKWNGINWSHVGTGVNNVVIDFAILNGELYAGGAFDTAGSVAANRIARWNGTTWAPVGTGIDPDWYVSDPTSVYALAVNNGILYAGGAFDTAGSVPANSIAKWDGTSWSDLNVGVDHGIINSLAVYNGEIYAGGDFANIGSVDAVGVAKWDGVSWSALGSGIGYTFSMGFVHSLAIYNGELYVGGYFFSNGNFLANCIAKWNGIYWSGVGQGVDNYVRDLMATDSALYIGGGFTHADTLPANKIVKWTGNCLNPLQPGIINGNDTVCNSSTQTYFVAPVPNATSYTWVLPPEWPGFSTSDTITTTPYYDGLFTISVWANNGCGNSPVQTLTISVFVPPSQPDPIIGNTIVCSGSTQTYSLMTTLGVTDYSWTLPAGWSGSSTTSSITVTTGINGGNISVRANNNCGSSIERIVVVKVDTVLANPGEITGNIFVFVNQKDSYSINQVNVAAGYSWSLSGGGTIVTGQNTNSVTINWSTPGEYILTVNATNSCGPGGSKSLNIKVSEVKQEDPFSIQLFPNPSHGEFYLKAKRVQDKLINVEVINMAGQLVFRSGKRQGANDYTQLLNLTKMAQGLYVVKINIDDKVYTRRIVKNE